MERAIYKMENAINSALFASRVKEHRYNGEIAFADCEDHPEEVYLKIMEGAEVLDPEQDYEWDMKIIPYYSRFSKVVGYTYPDKKEIWVNMKFYNRSNFTQGDIAENFSHEYMHKLGFGHSYRRNDNWPFTVPYAVGGIINDIVHPKSLPTEGSGTSFERMGLLKRLWFGLKRLF